MPHEDVALQLNLHDQQHTQRDVNIALSMLTRISTLTNMKAAQAAAAATAVKQHTQRAPLPE